MAWGPPKCYICHRPWHKSYDCPDRKSQKPGEPSKGASSKPGQPQPKRANWAAVGQNNNSLLGEVNGIQCHIIPDTGAEITIVPGHLVLASQLLEEYETIRGVAGGPVKAQCARVPIRFEGRQYVSRVVVANRDLLNDNVPFAVPLKNSTARQLFLDAALEADTSGAGKSGNAADVQGGADTEVNSPSLTREAETCPSGGEQQYQAVTRAVAKKVKAANHREQERARQQVKLSSFEETEPRPGISQPGAVDELQGSVPPEMGGAASCSSAGQSKGAVVLQSSAKGGRSC